MRKLSALFAAAVATTVIMPAAASAMTPPGSGNADPSPCAAHGVAIYVNGVNGNFGFLGAFGGVAGYRGVVGQSYGATGYSNSHLPCHP